MSVMKCILVTSLTRTSSGSVVDVFALADIRYFFLHLTFLSDHSLFIFGHNTALQGHHVDSNTAADTPTLVMFSSADVQQQDFKL